MSAHIGASTQNKAENIAHYLDEKCPGWARGLSIEDGLYRGELPLATDEFETLGLAGPEPYCLGARRPPEDGLDAALQLEIRVRQQPEAA